MIISIGLLVRISIVMVYYHDFSSTPRKVTREISKHRYRAICGLMHSICTIIIIIVIIVNIINMVIFPIV